MPIGKLYFLLQIWIFLPEYLLCSISSAVSRFEVWSSYRPLLPLLLFIVQCYLYLCLNISGGHHWKVSTVQEFPTEGFTVPAPLQNNCTECGKIHYLLSWVPYELAPGFGILNCFMMLLSEHWCLEKIELAYWQSMNPQHMMFPGGKLNHRGEHQVEQDVRCASTGAG